MPQVLTVMTHQGQGVVIADVMKGDRDQAGPTGGQGGILYDYFSFVRKTSFTSYFLVLFLRCGLKSKNGLLLPFDGDSGFQFCHFFRRAKRKLEEATKNLIVFFLFNFDFRKSFL